MARIILRDGRVADLRPPENTERDRALLAELFRNASPDSLYLRFFHMVAQVSPAEIERMMALDQTDSYSLVADAGDRFLAIGDYVLVGPEMAEASFFVDDRMQGKGLGTLLLEHLAAHAWRRGLRQFEAYVLRDNLRMLNVFQSSGFEIRQQWEEGILRLWLPLGETERRRALQDTRDKLATAASLKDFFEPTTVAVIGASRDPSRLGHRLLRHVVDGEFQGTVYPINPEAHSVAAIRAFPSLLDVPEPVDLAVVVVPAAQCLPVIDDCIRARAGAVVLTSSGFSDAGPEGLALEQEIARRLRLAGIRLLGPNGLGLVNTGPAVRLNASFAPALPPSGPLAIASHSGALGIAILDYASRIGVGVSQFASMGNKADVSGNDLLQYWEDDPATQIIVLYLESFGNPRKFTRIARRVSRKKPVLAVKSARDQELDAPTEALFRQTGIIRADTLEELFDIAALIAAQPLPRGRRVAVITNTAAAAVITLDALGTHGLEIAFPPIDLGFEDLAAGYRRALPQVLSHPDADAVLVLFIPVDPLEEEAAVSDAIRSEVAIYRQNTPPAQQKPILANFMATDDRNVRYLAAGASRIPVYRFPESAVRALAGVARYGEYRRQPSGRIPDLALDIESVRKLAMQSLAGGAQTVPAEVAQAMLQAMGLVPASPDDSREAAFRVNLVLTHHPLFGPLLTGRGRMTVVCDDLVQLPPPITRLIPLTDLDARMMARHLLETTPALCDRGGGLEDWLLRLSRISEEVPEIHRVQVDVLAQGASGWLAANGSIALWPPDAR